MQKQQYDLCHEVLRRLQSEKVLPHLILTGSWCLLLYRQYFGKTALFSTLRTRDIDFLVPLPVSIKDKVDVPQLLEDLGFVVDYKGNEGFMQLVHPELMLEFLVPQRGRESNYAHALPQLGMNAQPLRYMDMATMHTIKLTFEGVPLSVPHPASFALHKLLVAPRRKDETKRARDIAVAVELLNMLLARRDTAILANVVGRIPASWRKTIFKTLKGSGAEDIRKQIEPFSASKSDIK